MLGVERVNLIRLFLVVVVLSVSSWAGPAAAEVKVSFYSHGWGVGPNGFTYFPHAFIRIEGAPAGGEPVDDTFGFTATDPTAAALNLRGYVKPADPRYIGNSQLHFWVIINDDTYRVMMDRIAWWQSPEGWVYNIRSRNCIDFVADMAATLGLEPGGTRTWKPGVFMDDTVRRNAGKLILPGAAPAVQPDPPNPSPAQPDAGLPAKAGT